MTLFQKAIIDNYNIMNYKDDFLLLHCSRNDLIYAPFDGQIKATENGCVLHNEDFDLYISHIKYTYKNNEIESGDVLGIPTLGKVNGNNIAYIGIKICYKNDIVNPIIYLEQRDKDIKEVKHINDVDGDMKSQPKRKSNQKKK